jgi:hypothetical protein
MCTSPPTHLLLPDQKIAFKCVCVCVLCGVTSLYIPGFDMGVGSGGVSSWENGTANFSPLSLSLSVCRVVFLDRFNRSISSVYSFVDLRVVLQRTPWHPCPSVASTWTISTTAKPSLSRNISHRDRHWPSFHKYVKHSIGLICSSLYFVLFFFVKYLWLYFTRPRPHRYY